MIVYKIDKSLHDMLETEFNLGISYLCDDGSYEIEKPSLERLISNGVALDQFFVDKFDKNAESYLSDFADYPYLIRKYVSDEFLDFPIENIDFKIHLKSDCAVVKFDRNFSMNGKPEYVRYKINNDIIAKRKWEFIVNSVTNFPEDVKEYLAYYKSDGTLGDYFLIKHDNYDPIEDSDEIMTQLSRPRKNIVKQLKGLVYKNLSVADPSLSHENKLLMSAEFFNDYAAVLNVFIEIGVAQGPNADDNYIVNKIIIDMNPLDGILKYPLLSHPYFGNPSIKLYEVIIAKLTY